MKLSRQFLAPSELSVTPKQIPGSRACRWIERYGLRFPYRNGAATVARIRNRNAAETLAETSEAMPFMSSGETFRRYGKNGVGVLGGVGKYYK